MVLKELEVVYQIALVRSVLQMPPIPAERRNKSAIFVPQAEALLMVSLGRAGPRARPGQREVTHLSSCTDTTSKSSMY